MVRAAEVLEPQHVLIENVPGALNDRQAVVQRTADALDELGYQVSVGVIDLCEIGVPQRRRRLALMASLTRATTPADVTERHRRHSPRVCAIQDLEAMPESQRVDLQDAVARSAPATRQRIDFLFESGMFDLPDSQRPPCHASGGHSYQSIYGRLAWDRPSQTITTGFYSMCMGRYVHPSRRRTITAREAARLQYIPDWFRFDTAQHRTALARDDRQRGAVTAELRDRAGMAAVNAPSRSGGLFVGIGGLELGMAAGGHHTELLVESATPAMHVLRHHFPDTKLERDVRELRSLPATTDLVVAGFPCQDLSSVGRKVGIGVPPRSLVGEVFRLLGTADVPWVVLENVPFLMSLAQGAALRLITTTLTERGYRWAYRVVDSNAFGLPQRRNLGNCRSPAATATRGTCSSSMTPKSPCPQANTRTRRAVSTGPRVCAHSAGPSTGSRRSSAAPPVGVASPPAIRMPTGRYVTPDLRDAERLQGFPVDWTAPAEEVAKAGERWRLVGNSVSVPAAAWIGRRLASPGCYDASDDLPWTGAKWPRRAAWADLDGVVHSADVGPWPEWHAREPLADFLAYPRPAVVGTGRVGVPAANGTGHAAVSRWLHRGTVRLRRT